MRHHSLFRSLMVVSLLCAGTIPVAAAANALGLIVINDGGTSKANSPAAEFVEFENFGVTFSVKFLNGRKYSGPIGQVLALVDYTHSDKDIVKKKLAEVESSYPRSAALVQARLEVLAAAPAGPSTAPAGSKRTYGIPEATIAGTTYKNIKPHTMRDGLLGFVHDSGAFKVPAEIFSHSNLLQFAVISPQLREDTDFQGLLTTFEQTIWAGGEDLSGVRLIDVSGSDVRLLTDSGEKQLTTDDLSPEMLAKAEAATERFTTWKKGIADRIEVERQRLIAEARARDEQAAKERLAKIEAERARARAAAEMWGTIGSAVVNSMFAPRPIYVY